MLQTYFQMDLFDCQLSSYGYYLRLVECSNIDKVHIITLSLCIIYFFYIRVSICAIGLFLNGWIDFDDNIFVCMFEWFPG